LVTNPKGARRQAGLTDRPSVVALLRTSSVLHTELSLGMSWGSRDVPSCSCNHSVNMAAMAADFTIVEQRSVIRFLCSEGVKPHEIHRRSWHNTEKSPDIAPSNYLIFGLLVDALRGCRFANNEEIKPRCIRGFIRKRKRSSQMTSGSSWTKVTNV